MISITIYILLCVLLVMYSVVSHHFFFTLLWSLCLWLNLFLIETREYFWLVKPEVSILSYIQVCAIKAPGFGENRKANLDDLAIFTGAEVMHALESLTLASGTSLQLFTYSIYSLSAKIVD